MECINRVQISHRQVCSDGGLSTHFQFEALEKRLGIESFRALISNNWCTNPWGPKRDRRLADGGG